MARRWPARICFPAEKLLKADVAQMKDFIQAGEQSEREISDKLTRQLEVLPNLPLADVPDGEDEHGNIVYRVHGEKPEYPFKPKEHFEIGEALGLMDFEGASKLAGARFTILCRDLARLERALGQFMLDVHTGEYGYDEMSPPLLVNDNHVWHRPVAEIRR
ncbi:MAG: hypothetical protein R3D29_15765 [Nitratireductor sp.]